MRINTEITGKFVFSSSFESLNNNLIYVTTSRTPIREMVSNGLDPLNTIYTPAGIESEYEKDYTDNVYIIGLKKVGGIDVIYVPEKCILAMPETDGVYYVEKLLVFNLGLVPVDLDLENLTSDVKDTIENNIGLDVEVKYIDNSSKELINKTKHEENMLVRKYYLANNKSTKVQLDEALELNNNLLKQIELINTAVKLTKK